MTPEMDSQICIKQQTLVNFYQFAGEICISSWAGCGGAAHSSEPLAGQQD